MPSRRRGFSVVELLIVIGIIAMLIAILMPTINRVRRMAQGTRCLANLHQWGASYQMYLNGNHGRSFPDRQDLTDFAWYERLLPYNNKTGATLICPVASDSGNAIGSAFQAWGPNQAYSSAAPNWTIRGTFVGSYGLNAWLYDIDYQAIPQDWRERVIRLPAQGSDRIPVLGDCSEERGIPRDTDTPGDLIHPRPFVPPGGHPPPEPPGGHWGDLRLFCLDRHERAVNLVFLDGHAERVPLAQLWKLKWNNHFVPRDVVIP